MMFQRISLEIVAKKFEKIFTVDLTLTTYCQIGGEDFVNVCGLLKKDELYLYSILAFKPFGLEF